MIIPERPNPRETEDSPILFFRLLPLPDASFFPVPTSFYLIATQNPQKTPYNTVSVFLFAANFYPRDIHVCFLWIVYNLF